jgi:hypothetical protein
LRFAAGAATALRLGGGFADEPRLGATLARAEDLAADALAGRDLDDLVDFTMTGSNVFQPAQSTLAPAPQPGQWEQSSMDEAQPGNAHHDQINRNDVVEQLRHDEDQNSRNQCHDRLDVGDGQHGLSLLEEFSRIGNSTKRNLREIRRSATLERARRGLVQA